MPKYKVTARVTMNCFTIVETTDEDAAHEIAEERELMSAANGLSSQGDKDKSSSLATILKTPKSTIRT